MLRHKLKNNSENGFTLVELMVVIVILSTTSILFANFFIQGYQGYLSLQGRALQDNDVSNSLQRVSRVLRGMNSISIATSSEIEGFTYFTPRDALLSKVRYYYDSSDNKIKVAVIPASGTAPNYTYNVSDQKIINIAEGIDGSKAIFEYLNSANNVQVFTAANFKEIKGIKISLKQLPTSYNQNPISLSTSVTLRNRKSNL